MDARFLINDGQHRRAAIELALKEDHGRRRTAQSVPDGSRRRPVPPPPAVFPSSSRCSRASGRRCWDAGAVARTVRGRGAGRAGRGVVGGSWGNRGSWRTGCEWSSPRIQCCSGRG
ncbi:DNA sulfur modification protein DndB [Streptomyces olivaceus]|uniref:DNA sulfur modification protein DndB n=1 Tax=Streptomyces olivaceus TaxID=47716 RepID=UPI00340A8D26